MYAQSPTGPARRPVSSAAILLAALLYGTAWAQSDPLLEWNRDYSLLTLRAEQADLRHLLRDLSGQRGFSLWISDRVETGPVDLEFESLPLNSVLERILKAYSFVMVTNDDGDVSALSVLPAGESQPMRLHLETGSEQEQVMQRILASDAFSNDIKSALLLQAITREPAAQEPDAAQRMQAFTALIDHIEAVGSAKPETLRRLRASIAKQQIGAGRETVLNENTHDRAGAKP